MYETISSADLYEQLKKLIPGLPDRCSYLSLVLEVDAPPQLVVRFYPHAGDPSQITQHFTLTKANDNDDTAD